MAEPAVVQGHTLLTHPLGLHARPAVRLAQLAARFRAEVYMRVDDQGEWVSTRSAAQLMRLRARTNSVVCFRAEGEDARDAVVEMVALVDRDFKDNPEGEWWVPAEIASPGLACGRLWILPPWAPPPTPATTAQQERARLEMALGAAAEELQALASRAGHPGARILQVQLAWLADPGFLQSLWAAVAAGSSALEAWQALLEDEMRGYREARDEYLRARVVDLRDLQQRVARHLCGETGEVAPAGEILFCAELTPSRLLNLDPERLHGVVLGTGSRYDHVAILARCRELPMLIGPRLELRELQAGSDVVVDAEAGRLVLNPKVTTMTRYSKTLAVRAMEAAVADQFLMDPARTGGGEPLRICLDVADLSHLDGLDPAYCDGIDRVRSEALFDVSEGWPDEDTQYRRYRRLLDWAGEKPVAIATFDPSAGTAVAGFEMPAGADSPLGLRGVRLSLACPAWFRTQLRALCRTAVHGELRVLLPMLSTPAELEQVRSLSEEALAALTAEGHEAKLPELGLLLSVPAAALALEAFPVAMVSVDLDDLVQYLLAADRRCAGLAELQAPGHPAVLELLGRIVQQAGARGAEVSVCGSLAARSECLPALLDTGVRRLAVSPRQLARVKARLAEF